MTTSKRKRMAEALAEELLRHLAHLPEGVWYEMNFNIKIVGDEVYASGLFAIESEEKE